MIFEALLASLAVATLSLIGVFLFGQSKHLTGLERFIVPASVGVFLGLVLFELLPETYEAAGDLGSAVVALGFLSFYILSSYLHNLYHCERDEDCARKNASTLVLVGDAIHNLSDGFILGSAFLINPALGVATAIGLAIHEIPQEIAEFGILLRGGYTKTRAMMLNFISALSIVLGTFIVLIVSVNASEYVWIFVALAAGNLLYLSASELLPGVHSNLPHYRSVWYSAFAVLIGFVLIGLAVQYAHELVPEAGHADEDEHTSVSAKLHSV